MFKEKQESLSWIDFLSLIHSKLSDYSGEQLVELYNKNFADCSPPTVADYHPDEEEPFVISIRSLSVFVPEHGSSETIAYKKYEEFLRIYDKSLSLFNENKQTQKGHTEIGRAYITWKTALAEYWLKTLSFSWRVCVNTIRFQHPEENYKADEFLRKGPLAKMVVTDSESDQGLWYCGDEVLPKAQQHLEFMGCTDINVVRWVPNSKEWMPSPILIFK
jgi:hypothetical protein